MEPNGPSHSDHDSGTGANAASDLRPSVLRVRRIGIGMIN